MTATTSLDHLLASIPPACRPAMVRFLVDMAAALGRAPPPEPVSAGQISWPEPGEPLPIETLDELTVLLRELQAVFAAEDPPVAVHVNPEAPIKASIVNITLLADGSVALALSGVTRDGDPAAWGRKPPA